MNSISPISKTSLIHLSLILFNLSLILLNLSLILFYLFQIEFDLSRTDWIQPRLNSFFTLEMNTTFEKLTKVEFNSTSVKLIRPRSNWNKDRFKRMQGALIGMRIQGNNFTYLESWIQPI